MMRLEFRVAIIFVLLLQFQENEAAVEIGSTTLKNNKTGESYVNTVVTQLLTDLSNIAEGQKNSPLSYYSRDIASVSAIQSLQDSLIDLSTYFASNQEGFSVNKYISGVALEYTTAKCDAIVSNRFPRSTSSIAAPWKYYSDSVYYYIDCRKNATDISQGVYRDLHKRDKRSIYPHNAKRLLKRSVKNMHQKRKRRSIKYNDPSICGSTRVFESMSGNLTFPATGNYSALIRCVWHIKVPVKYAVAIAFDFFELEYDRKCYFDRLEFFDGSGTQAKLLGKFCGTNKPIGIKSSMNTLTIQMTTDDTIEKGGFRLKWSLTASTPPHPGFMITSNIAVDQIGPPPSNPKLFSFVFKNPKTCGLASRDVYCYFQYETTIISRIIATKTIPEMQMNGKEVEVIFEHIIELKSFPTLYNSKIFCMRWNTTIPLTGVGAWSRYGGRVFKTDQFKTVCRYEKPGIYAVIVEAPFMVEPTKFKFTGTFYSAILFAIVWLVCLLAQWSFSRRINVPEWLNFNQGVALLLFLGVVLSGVTSDYAKSVCSLLAFLLYYFGFGAFFWQFLKAAQVTGKFDDFFAKGRNEYIFYFILGWTIPIFVAGMAAGAMFFEKADPQSCWLALVGGTIWGYTSPTYFLVIANLYLLYPASLKTKKNQKRFNHPALRKRILRDVVQVLLFILTWVFGILCVLHKTEFVMQYCFCISLILSVTLLSLGAKQRRPGFQKIHYPDLMAKEKSDHELQVTNLDEVVRREEIEEKERKKKLSGYMSMKAFKRWRRFKKFELKVPRMSIQMTTTNVQYERHTVEDKESKSTVRSQAASFSSQSQSSSSDEDQAKEESSSQISSSDDDESMSRPSTRGRVRVEAELHQNRSVLSSTRLMEEEKDVSSEMDDDREEQEETRPNTAVTPSQASLRNSTRQSNKTLNGEGTRAGQDPLEEDDNILIQENREIEGDEINNDNYDQQRDHWNEGRSDQSWDRDQLSPQQPNDEVQEGDEGEVEGNYEQEDPEMDVPVITRNAFGGGTPDNGAGLLAPVATPTPSRLHSRDLRDRPVEKDAMSVCSLGEDENQEDNNEQEDNGGEDLYDISMY